MERFGARMAAIAERVMPDPFVLAVLLTALAAAVFVVAGGGAADLAATWVAGASAPGGLAFALQMSLVLVTGHALASSPPVRRLIARLARVPSSGRGAVALVAFFSCCASLIHWGLGAVCGALLAREMGVALARRGVDCHYPLLGAAGYAGFAVWHGGLSGSAPLKVAEPGHFLEELVGVVPVSETLFGTLNLVVTGGLLVGIPLLLRWMSPAAGGTPAPSGGSEGHDASADAGRAAPSATDVWTARFVGAAVVVGVGGALGSGGATFDINTVNLLFFGAGLVAQGSLAGWLASVSDGARSAGAVITQFPLYFGIIALLREAGAISWMSDGLISITGAWGFPAVAFFAASFVNLLVPSGGGQWAVQGPILLEAGQALGVDPVTTVLAFSWGDASSNMLQPFWALPLLAILRLRAGQIIGYTAIVFAAMCVWVTAGLLVAGAWVGA